MENGDKMKNFNISNRIFSKLQSPFTYTVITAFAIFCACLCITINQFIIKETYSDKTANAENSPIMDCGTIIHQEININGYITELGLQTEGISEGDKGNIEILLKHPKGSILKSFSLGEIFNNDQNILVKFSPNMVGPIDMYISGEDIINPITLKTRSEKLLGKYDVNGIVHNGNLAVVIKTAIIPRYSYLRICLLVVMLITLGYHIYCSSKLQQGKGLYWISLIYILCTICIRYPGATLLAEPCWETLTNFSHQTLIRGGVIAFFLMMQGIGHYFPD